MQPETSPAPLVSISIVSHGQATLVKRLLESISEHDDNRKLEIILTENVPSEIVNIEQLNYPNLRQIVNPKPKGFGANHNQSSKIARGEYFCILNPDVVFVESLLPHLIEHIIHRRGDIVAPLIVDSRNEIQDSFRSIPTPGELIKRRLKRKPGISLSVESEFIYPDWIAAIFLIMRMSSFNSIGGFDEKFRLYFEDVDFGARARLNNMRLLVDAKRKLLHDASRQSRDQPLYFLQHLYSAALFFASNTYRQAKKI